LSVDALHDRLICDEPAAVAVRLAGVDGRVVSAVVPEPEPEVEPDDEPDVDPDDEPDVDPDEPVPVFEPDDPVAVDGPGSAILLREMISSSYQV
jgi:hypothetical protein